MLQRLQRIKPDQALTAAAVFGGGLLALMLFGLWSNCSWRAKPIHPDRVWAYLEKRAPDYDLSPEFAFAIVFAESSFDAHADSGYARGLMQLSKGAWETVSDRSYGRAWDWQDNLDAGLAYLAHLRGFLDDHNAFSYPLLAASYRWGPYAVKRRGFDMSRVKPAKNEVYKQLFAGEVSPVAPPY
ncbi:MAG: transglycosylase SLT domain-containing protein [Opitutales bacterium]